MRAGKLGDKILVAVSLRSEEVTGGEFIYRGAFIYREAIVNELPFMRNSLFIPTCLWMWVGGVIM